MNKKHVVIAWPESASGPGWFNTPIWYVWRDGANELHLDCLQPDEQTDEMQILFSVAEQSSLAITDAVSKHINCRIHKRKRRKAATRMKP